jgi:WXG100 family type VII secretion target
MPNLNVTYQEMSDTASKMRNDKAEIDARLADCKSIVDSMTANGFVTEQASGRFEQVSSDFVNSANKAMETLDQLSQWLDKAVDALRQMDSDMANSLNQSS